MAGGLKRANSLREVGLWWAFHLTTGRQKKGKD